MRLQSKHIALLVTVLGMLITAPGLANSAQGKALIRKTQGYSLTMPAGWNVTTSSSPAADAILSGPGDANSRMQVVVSVTQPFPNASVTSAGSVMKAELKQQMPGFHLLSQRVVPVDGQPAVETVGTAAAPGTSKKIRLDEYLISGKKHCYAVVLTAPESDSTRSEKEYTALIRSFKMM